MRHKTQYSIRNGQVYLDTTPLPQISAQTFVALDVILYLDRNADTSFDPAAADEYYHYAKDAHGVYCDGALVHHADPATFLVAGLFPLARDERHVYYWNKVLPQVQAASFVRLAEQYIKDHEHVWYLERGDWKRLHAADPATFRAISPIYSKDARRAFYRLDPIEQADASTFELVLSAYARDAAHVFYAGRITVGADPATFEVFGDLHHYDEYARDERAIYYLDHVLEGADRATFALAGAGFLAEDKNFTYYHNNRTAK